MFRPQVIPACCLSGASGLCRVTVHCIRERKTGPGFPLFVIRCAVHGVAHTLYPPGYVPYARVAIAPVGPSGQVIPTEDGTPSLAGTLHEAAEDVVHGKRWPESGDEACWTRRTQGRRLHRIAVLLGLLTDPDDPRTQERIAYALGVPLLVIREAATTYSNSRAWRTQAAALLGVLAVALTSSRPAGLLHAGHEAGLWGPPRRWDPGGGRLVAPF